MRNQRLEVVGDRETPQVSRHDHRELFPAEDEDEPDDQRTFQPGSHQRKEGAVGGYPDGEEPEVRDESRETPRDLVERYQHEVHDHHGRQHHQRCARQVCEIFAEQHRATTQRAGEEVGVEDLPHGLDTSRYQWVDLDGEGLTGLLAQHGDSWYYKRNEGAGQMGKARRLDTRPSLGTLARSDTRLMDVDASVYLTDCDPSAYRPGDFVQAEIVGVRDYDLLVRPVGAS